MSSTTLLIPAAGKFVKFAPDIAGKVAGNLASGIVPEPKLEALSAVKDAPLPEKVVAVSKPDEELKVKLEPLFGGKSPVAAVANIGKQVVSLDSSATVTFVAILAVPELDRTVHRW